MAGQLWIGSARAADWVQAGAATGRRAAGLPNDTATGDDANNIDDEDGVFIGNLTPGVTSNITVTVTTVNNLTGK